MSGPRLPGRSVLVAAALAPLLAACAAPVRPSREAVSACVAQAGVSGTFAVTTTLRGNAAEVLLRPGPDVTPAQAEVANACIARLTAPASAAGPVVATSAAPVGAAPVGAAAPAPAITPSSSAPPIRSRASCPLEMVGGAGYACRQ